VGVGVNSQYKLDPNQLPDLIGSVHRAISHVASFAHPGGNVTGLSSIQEDTAAKQLGLLKTAVPRAERIAVLVDPGYPAHAGVLRTLRKAAYTLRTELLSIEVRASGEIDGAFSAMTRERADAPIVPGGPPVTNQRSQIAELAASHKLPAIYYGRELVMAGGLMSYGADLKDTDHRPASGHTHEPDRVQAGQRPRRTKVCRLAGPAEREYHRVHPDVGRARS
jgi:putative ABC transport system substrate-binding protein